MKQLLIATGQGISRLFFQCHYLNYIFLIVLFSHPYIKLYINVLDIIHNNLVIFHGKTLYSFLKHILFSALFSLARARIFIYVNIYTHTYKHIYVYMHMHKHKGVYVFIYLHINIFT